MPVVSEELLKIKVKRRLKCREETGQDHEVKELVQAEAWEVEAEVDVKVAAAAGEEVLPQVRADTVSVQTVVKKQPINWGAPAMSRNAPNAEQL
ncbi:MAG: hypothetical protein V2J25_08020 [Desulfatiglans sp.]|nr:hypothetical protein [Desulfatiglans sp.]